MLLFILFLIPGICVAQGNDDDEFLWDTFSDGFQWGSATSSYQVEGAWNIDGKKPRCNTETWHRNLSTTYGGLFLP